MKYLQKKSFLVTVLFLATGIFASCEAEELQREISSQVLSEESSQAVDDSQKEVSSAAAQETLVSQIFTMDDGQKILLTTDWTFEYVPGVEAALSCTVYALQGDETKELGIIESFGTAYPIAITGDALFCGSGHSLIKYVISRDGELVLEKSILEAFDKEGNASYTEIVSGKTVTEETFRQLAEEYGQSQIVNFAEQEPQQEPELEQKVYQTLQLAGNEVILKELEPGASVQLRLKTEDGESMIAYYDQGSDYYAAEEIVLCETADIMGYPAFYIHRVLEWGFPSTDYFGIADDRAIRLGDSWGTKPEESDFIVDINGDGITELVCNVVYGDGVCRTEIYYREGENIYECEGSELLDEKYDDVGIGSWYSEYLPQERKIKISYWVKAEQEFREKLYEIDLEKLESRPYFTE